MKTLILSSLVVGLFVPCRADRPSPASGNAPATITSDVMELTHHGATTIFKGHVVLTQEPYRVIARKMVQDRKSGVVDLYDDVVGIWNSEKGDRVESVGDRARYTPSTQILELWGGHPQLTRWENPHDLQPMIVTADRFVADQPQKTVWAEQNVHMIQGERIEARAAEARYRTVEQILELGGPGQVFIHINDGRGQGDFYSDSAWMSVDPRHAQLVNHVKGHIIPAAKSSAAAPQPQ